MVPQSGLANYPLGHRGWCWTAVDTAGSVCNVLWWQIQWLWELRWAPWWLAKHWPYIDSLCTASICWGRHPCPKVDGWHSVHKWPFQTPDHMSLFYRKDDRGSVKIQSLDEIKSFFSIFEHGVVKEKGALLYLSLKWRVLIISRHGIRSVREYHWASHSRDDADICIITDVWTNQWKYHLLSMLAPFDCVVLTVNIVDKFEIFWVNWNIEHFHKKDVCIWSSEVLFQNSIRVWLQRAISINTVWNVITYK